MSQEDVQTALAKVQRALELQALSKPQAEADGLQGHAVAALITALADVPTAAIHIGSLLILKVSREGVPQVVTITLSSSELAFLERNRNLLKSPNDLLQSLRE
jgi:hypothetical protein